MRDGTDQNHRSPRALEPGYFRVDELGFEQRVSISERLAARLAFIDLEGRPSGSWQSLVRGDPMLLLAALAAEHVGQRAPALSDVDSAEVPSRMAAEVLQLARRLDRWLRELRAADARHAVECGDLQRGSQAGRVAQAIEQRIADRLAAELAGVLQPVALAPALQSLLPLWRDALRAHPNSGEDHPPAMAELRARWLSFAAALREVQQLARELLPLTADGGRQEPAAALLATFLQLYQRVQQRINRFTERHIDFYYLDCLRFRPRSGVADRLHLACARDPRIVQDVRVAAGAVFAAGKDSEGRPIEYRAEQALDVTDVRVAALCKLTLERHELISPERELGHVTRVMARSIAPDAAPPSAQAPWWPLFGGEGPDATLGLALASPLLWLGEGVREIKLSFGFSQQPRQDALAVQRLLRSLRRQDSQEGFFRCFGQLFTRWMLAAHDTLDARARERIRRAALRWVSPPPRAESDATSPLALLWGWPLERELVFHRLFEGAFAVSLSMPEGWLQATETHLSRAPAGSGHALTLTVRLRAHDAPVTACVPAVHGERWNHGLPMMQLRLVRESRQCPYCLLTALDLSEVRVEVSVRGLRDVTLANQLGRLDPSRPFQPFGPLPDIGSYLVIGARELACKPVTNLDVRLQWSGLPVGDGDFAAQYAGYARPVVPDSFTVDAALLRGGLWQEPEGILRDPRLFAAQPGGTRMSATRRLTLEPAVLRRLFHPEAGGGQRSDFHYDMRSRNGFVRLRLASPEGAFGHQEHPLALTRVVTANARRKGRAQPLPKPPYTPLLERVTIDYRAASSLRLDTPSAEHRLYHLHPFGIQRIDTPEAGPCALLPRYPDGGHLMIGLQAAEPGGLLTLLFHLRDAAATARQSLRPALEWAWLKGDGWMPLPPDHLLSDTTDGMLTSGIVTLALPAEMTGEHRVMPSGLFWLRVSAAGGFDSFAGLHDVLAQALTLARCPGEHQAEEVLPPRRVSGPATSLAGLASVLQVAPSFGLRRGESAAQLRVRAGERLRHRQRASTTWDVERLVLEEFPAVFKVKCFAHRRSDLPGASAGDMLVAVVPSALPDGALQLPRMHAGELQRITEFLARHASPFARIQVLNAAYEQVQVRCRVRLARAAHTGRCLQQLERAIVDYLSPWSGVGRPATFGWSLRCEDVQSFIRTLPDVTGVSGVSLLQVAEDPGGSHALADTARPRSGMPRAEATLLSGHLAWSIAVPMARHLVELCAELRQDQAQPSGVSHLGIGSTFIVGEV